MVVDYEKEGRIAIFTINRPEVRNAQNLEVKRRLHDAFVDFRDDPDLWVCIITGAGEKAFCAGADMKELLPFMREHLPGSPWAMPANPIRGFELWKPIIAAINGLALGGGLELALACDIRIASENARFGQPEVTIGLIPGGGGTQRLPRLIPWCKAAEMILMGRIIDAAEAYRIGLVNAVVPQEQLMSTAKEWAEEICRSAPLAVRAAKEAMVKGTSMSLEQGLQLENTLEGYVVHTEDYIEGTTAFVEKRKPDFKAK